MLLGSVRATMALAAIQTIHGDILALKEAVLTLLHSAIATAPHDNHDEDDEDHSPSTAASCNPNY